MDLNSLYGPEVYGYVAFQWDGDVDMANPYVPGCKAHEEFKKGWAKAEKEYIDNDVQEF
jgi:hypothetical protein